MVDSGRPRGVPVGKWEVPTDEATALVLLADERELRVLVGGEVAASSFAGPCMIWVIFALGRNAGVAGAVAGESGFE